MLALPNTIQAYVVIIFVGLVINLALGLYLLRWDPRSTVNRLVAITQGLLAIWGATSLVALVLETNWVTPTTFTVLRINALVNYLGSSFVGCTWLHLALLFPRRHPVTRCRWLYPLLYGPNTLFYLLRLTNPWHSLFYQFSLIEGQFISVRGRLFWGFLVLSYSQIALAVVSLTRTALRLDDALQRKQATILVGATLLVVGGHVVRVTLPHLLAADPSLLLLTLSGILYAYGVLRYRLLGLSVILNRAVVYGLTWLVLAAMIFVVLSLLRPAWRALPTWQLALMALLAFGLLTMVRNWVGSLVERSLNRDRQAYQQAVQEFMEQLTSVTSSDQLLPGVVDFRRDSVRRKRGHHRSEPGDGRLHAALQSRPRRWGRVEISRRRSVLRLPAQAETGRGTGAGTGHGTPPLLRDPRCGRGAPAPLASQSLPDPQSARQTGGRHDLWPTHRRALLQAVGPPSLFAGGASGGDLGLQRAAL